MSSSSVIGIINFALHQLGAERVNSLTENNKRARLANDLYSLSRDEVLAEGYWYSALKIIKLSLHDQKDGLYRYYIPADFIRLRRFSSDCTVDGEYVYSHSGNLEIQYISNSTSIGRYTASLRRAIGYKLALDMCFSITQSLKLAEGLEQLYQQEIDKGLGYSTVDQGESVVEISSEINEVRGGSSNRTPYWLD